MTIDILRQDRFLCSVAVDGIGNLGTFDSLTGGDTNAQEAKYRPGGMATEVVLGGTVTVANLVVHRGFQMGRHDVLIPKLRAVAGRADASVTLQPLDQDANPFGRPETWTGKLQRVMGPQHDSMTTTQANLELEIAPGGTVA